MSNNVTYQVNLKVVGEDVIGTVTKSIEKMTESTRQATKTFGDCYKALLSISQVAEGLGVLEQGFSNLMQTGASLNANMLELSAITGVTGNGLKAIEKAARETAKTFGTSAVDNVEAYKMMLSQLSPEIANNAEAMKMMGENANILSKQMGGDTVAATEVLNTSLNQFGVSMDDPIAAAKIMADMMNVMSAAAQQGSAELPQIKQALEQVGMVAKTTGLSFAETNAYIQLLDQAGKKGSEGGVALRNVLTTLSEGRFTSKLAAEGLKQAGISVDYLADSSIPLHERLKTLRKIQGDTALMTKVFGKENMAAAIAMINTADEAEAMSKAIVGTNSAVEQADVIMGGYNEKINRAKAWIDDLKIGFFNLTENIAPIIQGFFSVFSATGQSVQAINALITAYNALNIRLFLNTIRTKALAVWTGIGSIANRGFASSLNAVRNSALGATLATRGFSLAILNIPVLGWIVAAIMAIVGAFILLWEHSRKFRKILFGIWEVAKATFHNIGVYATRLWGMVLKPIATAYWNLYKWIFSKVWEIAKMAWKGITSAISWAWNSVIKPVAGFIFNVYKRAFVTIWNVVKMVFNWIVNLISKVWNWIKTTFSEFASWLQTTLIDPIYEAFSKVWDWLNNLFGGIVDKLGSLAQPIKDLWNSIFSSEGTINVKTAYEKGEKKGGESFDRDQKAKQGKSDKPQEVKVVDDQSHKNIFDVGQGLKGSTGTIGGVAAEKTKKKKGRKGSGDGESDGGNKVRNLTVGKMVENLNIYTQKGTVGESKEQILQAIKEIFGTAVSDFAGADRHATTA
jgi:phage tail tape measure protein, TP901 family|nr:MAG TPA: minor tail protein [Caudoviricetes sp.]